MKARRVIVAPPATVEPPPPLTPAQQLAWASGHSTDAGISRETATVMRDAPQQRVTDPPRPRQPFVRHAEYLGYDKAPSTRKRRPPGPPNWEPSWDGDVAFSGIISRMRDRGEPEALITEKEDRKSAALRWVQHLPWRNTGTIFGTSVLEQGPGARGWIATQCLQIALRTSCGTLSSWYTTLVDADECWEALQRDGNARLTDEAVMRATQCYFEFVKSEANIADWPTREDKFHLIPRCAIRVPVVLPSQADWLGPLSDWTEKSRIASVASGS